MSRRSLIPSAELFADAREVVIEHADECYLLLEGPDGRLLLLDLPASAGATGVPLHRVGGRPRRRLRGCGPALRHRDRD